MIYLVFERSQGDLHQAGILARNKLFALFSLPKDDVETEENGKPYLKSDAAGFSISHSGDVALCALKTDEELYDAPDYVTVIFENKDSIQIGCDIEEVVPSMSSDKAKRISERFLGCPVNSPDEFTRRWTRGEAYGKYTGRGIPDAKNIPADVIIDTFQIDINNKKYYVSICT